MLFAQHKYSRKKKLNIEMSLCRNGSALVNIKHGLHLQWMFIAPNMVLFDNLTNPQMSQLYLLFPYLKYIIAIPLQFPHVRCVSHKFLLVFPFFPI